TTRPYATLFRSGRHAAHDKRLEERPAGFDVFGIDAGIPDHRVSHRHNLSGVRRVRQDLLISAHRGVENDFADSFALESVSFATKNTTVFEQQGSAFRAQSSVPIL